jgi:hypothetical protein
VVERCGGSRRVNSGRSEIRQNGADRLEHSRNDRRKRRSEGRDQRDRQPAEFDGRVFGDQVVEGQNIDAGDLAALEASADRLLGNCATRRPRLDSGGESLRRQPAIFRLQNRADDDLALELTPKELLVVFLAQELRSANEKVGM